MEERGSRAATSHRDPKIPLWIIEHAWAHQAMDLQQALNLSLWPDVGSQPPSLEESWRLRVSSAQMYSIVRRRNVDLFEKVVDFLETTYRLRPGLTASISHMKIIFGLKTLVIMWMLRENRDMADIAFKIIQFFPSKLPLYQDQCSNQEMFLMRKNHLDFKTLAQTLTVDKDKRAAYIKNQMEKHYGEHYIQKVEERLLSYLRKMETVLPEGTYIDKILQKESPVTEEERLLLDIIRSDSGTTAATLRKLLHCDAASCHPDFGAERESSLFCSPVLFATASAGVSGEEEVSPDASDETLSLLKMDGECVKGIHVGGNSSPQFCSKHQRWVSSILQECSEEPRLSDNVSSSPPLFQSSSSTSLSHELTPSGKAPPCPCEQQWPPTSQAASWPRTAATGSEHRNSGSSNQIVAAQILTKVQAALVSAEAPSSSRHSQVLEFTENSSAEQFSSGPSDFVLSCLDLSDNLQASGPPTSPSAQRTSPQITPRPEPQSFRSVQTVASPCLDFTLTSTPKSGVAPRAQLRLSLQSQAVLLQSKLLQPSVILTRLSVQECQALTSSPAGHVRQRSAHDNAEEGGAEEDDDASSSFDSLAEAEFLFSSITSDDSHLCDPDYQPSMGKKRLFKDQEAGRSLNDL